VAVLLQFFLQNTFCDTRPPHHRDKFGTCRTVSLVNCRQFVLAVGLITPRWCMSCQYENGLSKNQSSRTIPTWTQEHHIALTTLYITGFSTHGFPATEEANPQRYVWQRIERRSAWPLTNFLVWSRLLSVQQWSEDGLMRSTMPQQTCTHARIRTTRSVTVVAVSCNPKITAPAHCMGSRASRPAATCITI